MAGFACFSHSYYFYVLAFGYRSEEIVTELESSLMLEKQHNEATRRELGEAHQRIEELLGQVVDANGKSTVLQTTVQRSFPFCKTYNPCPTDSLITGQLFSTIIGVIFLGYQILNLFHYLIVVVFSSS